MYTFINITYRGQHFSIKLYKDVIWKISRITFYAQIYHTISKHKSRYNLLVWFSCKSCQWNVKEKIEMKKENKYLDRHVTHSRGWVQLAAAIASRARKVGSARLLFWIPALSLVRLTGCLPELRACSSEAFRYGESVTTLV